MPERYYEYGREETKTGNSLTINSNLYAYVIVFTLFYGADDKYWEQLEGKKDF